MVLLLTGFEKLIVQISINVGDPSMGVMIYFLEEQSFFNRLLPEPFGNYTSKTKE